MPSSHHLFWVLCLFPPLWWVGCRAGGRSPVILIPGDGGSALETRLSKPKAVPHWWCARSSRGRWKRLWIPPTSDLLPKRVDCWADNMRLVYNGTSVSNTEGVEIRPIPGSAGLELVPGNDDYNAYSTALRHLKDHDVTVATYDFRYTPRGNPSFLSTVKSMIEDAFRRSRSRVTLLTHSLGALFAHHFLTKVVDDEWKRRYIHAWIPISPAYGGAILGLKQVVSGDTGWISWLSGTDLRAEQRSYESSLWLLPSVELYADRTLVMTAEKNYTAMDYEELFRDAGFPTFPERWARLGDLTPFSEDGSTLRDPDVRVQPIYGIGVSTPATFVYRTTSLDGEPTVISTLDGDSTVALTSLSAGDGWSQAAPPHVLRGVDHTGIMSSPDALKKILTILDDDDGDDDNSPLQVLS